MSLEGDEAFDPTQCQQLFATSCYQYMFDGDDLITLSDEWIHQDLEQSHQNHSEQMQRLVQQLPTQPAEEELVISQQCQQREPKPLNALLSLTIDDPVHSIPETEKHSTDESTINPSTTPSAEPLHDSTQI